MYPLNYIALATITSQMHAYELVGVICQGLGETAIHFGNVVLNLVKVCNCLVVVFVLIHLPTYLPTYLCIPDDDDDTLYST